MDIVTIDFETYYDKKYSLAKMTVEEYIRSPDFEVIGVGVKVNDNPTDWYSGEDVGKFLNSLDYSDKAILCHNTYFDGAILSWKYGIEPKFWFDTMSMSKPKHQMTEGGSLKALVEYYKLGRKGTELENTIGKRRKDFNQDEIKDFASYCILDVDLTYSLFNKLKQGFPAHELMIIDQTLRMYTEPTVILDTTVLENHLSGVKQKKTDLINDLAMNDKLSEAQIKKVLMSNEMFASLLKLLDVEPPTKTSLRTGKVAYAFAKTDKAFTNLLGHDNPMVRNLLAARLGIKSTIEETRTERLIETSKRGYLPIMLKYYGAHTGRFSGGDKLNLQNLPRNGAIRKALTVPLGHKMIACDSSQIEARMTAYIAGQEDLLNAFREGRDVYSEFASDVYGQPLKQIDKVKRFVGKTCILGLGYGMGHVKFKDTLSLGMGGMSVDVDEFEAQRIVNLYRQKNHKIVGLWNRCNSVLTGMLAGGGGQINDILSYDHEGILMPNGMRIHYPALKADTNGFSYLADSRAYKKYMSGGHIAGNNWTRIYGGKVVENIVQALARNVVAEQMVRIGQRYHVSFQVHDEVIVIVKEEEVDKALEFIVQEMSKPPSWAPDLPVACEADTGDNYGEAK